MYNWLATQMQLDPEFCHVRWFTREQCRQAIKILRPRYIQLYGHDLPWRKENDMSDIPEEIENLAEDMSGSYWNYRWLKTVEEYDGEEEITYALHEVYYDKNGKPFMWTEEPVKLYCEDTINLMELIGKMLDACTEKVLLKYYEGEQPKIKEIDEYMNKSEELDKWRKKNKE